MSPAPVPPSMNAAVNPRVPHTLFRPSVLPSFLFHVKHFYSTSSVTITPTQFKVLLPSPPPPLPLLLSTSRSTACRSTIDSFLIVRLSLCSLSFSFLTQKVMKYNKSVNGSDRPRMHFESYIIWSFFLQNLRKLLSWRIKCCLKLNGWKKLLQDYLRVTVVWSFNNGSNYLLFLFLLDFFIFQTFCQFVIFSRLNLLLGTTVINNIGKLWKVIIAFYYFGYENQFLIFFTHNLVMSKYVKVKVLSPIKIHSILKTRWIGKIYLENGINQVIINHYSSVGYPPVTLK